MNKHTPINTVTYCGVFVGLVFMALTVFPSLAGAQVFDSGSTGANGAFPPAAVPGGTTDITLDLNDGTVTFLPGGTSVVLPSTPGGGFADGILHFTTVDVPAGVVLTFVSNAANTPVTFLVQGDVAISGSIDLTGESGQVPVDLNPGVGGLPGPGGFRGADGQAVQSVGRGGAGLGPGGGAGGELALGRTGSGGGFGAQGGQTNCNGSFPGGITYGTVGLLPLVGGSGGGGSYSTQPEGTASGTKGSGGGGGGGAILIASSTSVDIGATGSILSIGGIGGATNPSSCEFGGGGSGGAIRLAAGTISGSGTLNVAGGGTGQSSGVGGAGRIRLEAFVLTYSGPISGPLTTGAPGALFLPSISSVKIATVDGQAVPTHPMGHVGGVDVSVGAPGVVTIGLEAANVSPGTTVVVTAKPKAGAEVIGPVTSTPLIGTLDSSTATADIDFTTGGIVYFLEARATFTFP